MKLIKFINQAINEIHEFFYWYIRNRCKEEKNWPLDLNQGEWREQLYAYLNSDDEPILCDTCKNTNLDCGYQPSTDCYGYILRK